MGDKANESAVLPQGDTWRVCHCHEQNQPQSVSLMYLSSLRLCISDMCHAN
jgi:hypothetical protein